MTRRTTVLLLGSTLLLGACASVPTGPSQLVLPGTGKPFDVFRADEGECRQYASDAIGGRSAESAASDSTARSAALGTVVGAVAGAAIGGSRGAGVGAGTGLVLGTATGAGNSYPSSYTTQRRYDNAYIQCMYAKGHRVPVSGGFTSVSGTAATTVGSPAARPAIPPPPGNPPPPPAAQ